MSPENIKLVHNHVFKTDEGQMEKETEELNINSGLTPKKLTDSGKNDYQGNLKLATKDDLKTTTPVPQRNHYHFNQVVTTRNQVNNGANVIRTYLLNYNYQPAPIKMMPNNIFVDIPKSYISATTYRTGNIPIRTFNLPVNAVLNKFH